MKMNTGSARGSTLVEAALTLSLLMPCLVMGFSLVGASAARSLAQKFLYEGLICVLEAKSEYYCQKQIRQQLKQSIPLGHLSHLIVKQSPNFISGELHWQWNPQWTMKMSRFVPRDLEP